MAAKPPRAPFIPFDVIRVKADEFRSIHFAGQEPPLDIEAVLEFDLGVRINPVRGLREDYDMDALLLGTLDEVIVDDGEYMNDRMRNRLRFSLAHEIGHRELHRDVYAACQVQSVAEWMDLVQAIPEDDYAWMEATPTSSPGACSSRGRCCRRRHARLGSTRDASSPRKAWTTAGPVTTARSSSPPPSPGASACRWRSSCGGWIARSSGRLRADRATELGCGAPRTPASAPGDGGSRG